MTLVAKTRFEDLVFLPKLCKLDFELAKPGLKSLILLPKRGELGMETLIFPPELAVLSPDFQARLPAGNQVPHPEATSTR